MPFVFEQPFFGSQDRIVEGGETLLVVREFDSGSGFDDRGNKKRFVYIDITTGLVNSFQGQKLLSDQNGKEAIVCSITHFNREVKTILTVRS